MKRVLSWFGFNPKTMRLRTEVLAGGTTFLTMAYILAVNPQILGATGMDRGAQFTITAIASGCATLVMGWLSHLPLAMAPGMGVNAFFAYTVCNAMGYSWKFALLAVFLEGVLFLILTVTSLRERIIEAIPLSLKRAIGCGIGFFILFIGLRNGEVLVNSEATLVQLGDVTVGNALLTVIGVAITSMLFVLRVPGVFLIGIFVTTLIGIPLGLTHLSAVTALPPNPSELICAFSFKDIFTTDLLIVVFTLLFVDLFNSIGTLVGVASRAGLLNEKGEIPRIRQALMADAIATTGGALLGTSTISTYVESASGIEAGGRSGVTSLVTALCFFCALFFAPIFLAVPAAATAPVLILVGILMISTMTEVDLKDPVDLVPFVLCVALIPLSGNIADGLIAGVLVHILLRLVTRRYKELTLSTIILGIFFLLRFILK